MIPEAAEIPARVTFSEELRGRWPTRALVAEARLDGNPWSVRLRLWSAPDDTGACMASAAFLSPDAPYEAGKPIGLTLGSTTIGTFTLTATRRATYDDEAIDLLPLTLKEALHLI